MALLALAGSFLMSAAGTAHATPSAGQAVTTAASAPAASPAEGHSPQLTQALSGPLSGTGLSGSGASASGTSASGTSASPSGTMRQATAAPAGTAAATTAGTTVNGIDVASGQHPNGAAIDWTAVKSAGYEFAAIKATEANYYTNTYYTSDAQNATAAGMYVSPYAFANPYDSTDASGGNGTAQTQADDAAKYAATAEGTSQYTVGGHYLPMMLDIEYDPYVSSEANSNECYGLSASAMVSWIAAFLAEAKADTGATPIIYSTRDWWNTCTGSSTAFASDMLWVASYSSGTPGTLPAGWNNWNMWQYSSSGTVPGITGSVDLDYFSEAPENEQTPVNAPASLQFNTLNSLAGQSVTYTAAGLPAGTQINTSSGLITGTPATAGTYNVTVTAQDSTGAVLATIPFTWDVTPGTVSVTSPGNKSVTAGAAVDLHLAATDSVSGYTPSFTATGLPPGLSLSSSGTITGWPDTPGIYNTTVTATDSAGAQASGSASFTWTIGQAANSGPAGKVVLANGGKCLDDTGSSTKNGNKVQIWTCNGGTAQKWTVAQDGTLRVFGKCLDVTGGGTANGTTIQIWNCVAGDANQRWEVGTGAELINPHSGKCLDDPYSRTANGTKLDIWSCNGGSQQHWTLPAGPAASGIAGKCLDDKSGSTANGNKIEVWTCTGGGPQNWTVMPDGTVRVSGKCLDVTGGGTASGTRIQLWSCLSGDKGQQWKVTTTSDMAGELVNPNSGLCLADPADSTVNGTQLEIMTCSSADPGMSWHMR